MKINHNKKLYKKILFIGITIYVIGIFISQQRTLNSYKNSEKYYQAQIEEKIAYQQELTETKSNINSKDYIEKVAREKLDMYLPNERVYVAKGK